MNKFQVEFGKLKKVAKRAAIKHGYDMGSISPNTFGGDMHVALWRNNDIVASGTCKETPKAIKQKILYLSIEEKKNSQS